jgi:hypothetical protein
MATDLGAIAPLKFTGRAESWWRTQSTHVCNYLSESWANLLQAIQAHFLNANWLQERRQEWEEMHFRQRGHENEWPLDFIQRRLVYSVFLYPEEEDGVIIVDRILQTAPDVWAGSINSERYPDIFSLTAAVRRYCATLMGNWTTAQKLGNLNNYYPRQANHNAHVVDASDSDDDSDDGGGAGAATSNETKSAYVSSSGNTRGGQRPPAGFPGASNKSKTNLPRHDWPEGKTVKGYSFVKRDNVRSARTPTNGVC